MSYRLSDSPRSLKSFGIGGVLKENGYVFYDGFFSSRHLGKISDLISARIESKVPDELKLRSLLLFSFFEAYRLQVSDTDWMLSSEFRLERPISMEIGLDDTKIGVGIAIQVKNKEFITLSELDMRLQAESPSGPFEEILFTLLKISDQVILKHHEVSGRIELISILSLEEVENVQIDQKFELVLLNDDWEETPQVNNYIALGDLDYDKILLEKPEKPKEKVVHESEPKEDEGDQVTRIGGTTQHIKEGMTKVKGGGDDGADNTLMKVKSLHGEGEGDDRQFKLYQDQIKQLQTKITKLEEERKKYGMGGGMPTGQAWENAKQDDGKSEEQASADLINSLRASFAKKAKKVIDPTLEPEKLTLHELEKSISQQLNPDSDKQVVSSVPQESAETLVQQLLFLLEEGGLFETVRDFHKILPSVKKELQTDEVKKWVNELMICMMQERLSLIEFSKKLLKGTQAAAIEARNRVKMVEEELKHREIEITNKTQALASAKDQVAEMQLTVERLKSTTNTAMQDAQFKSKYQHLNKMYQSLKNENSNLVKKVADLKSSLSTAKQVAKSTKVDEFAQVSAQYEKAKIQLEEFKKVNRELMDKVANAERTAKGAPSQAKLEDLNRRLKQAVSAGMAKQKELDILKGRVKDMAAEISKLRDKKNSDAA